MNNNAKKWVAALRSGEYKQSKGTLRNDREHYCCLGVACELFVKDNPGAIEVKPSGKGFTEYGANVSVLPPQVTEWLDLRDQAGTYRIGVARNLTEDNDTGKTFDEIADIIESEPDGLFAT